MSHTPQVPSTNDSICSCIKRRGILHKGHVSEGTCTQFYCPGNRTPMGTQIHRYPLIPLLTLFPVFDFATVPFCCFTSSWIERSKVHVVSMIDTVSSRNLAIKWISAPAFLVASVSYNICVKCCKSSTNTNIGFSRQLFEADAFSPLPNSEPISP